MLHFFEWEVHASVHAVAIMQELHLNLFGMMMQTPAGCNRDSLQAAAPLTEVAPLLQSRDPDMAEKAAWLIASCCRQPEQVSWWMMFAQSMACQHAIMMVILSF